MYFPYRGINPPPEFLIDTRRCGRFIISGEPITDIWFYSPEEFLRNLDIPDAFLNESKYIVVDNYNQVLYLFEYRMLIGYFACSTGHPIHRLTPVGVYKVRRKLASAWSSPHSDNISSILLEDDNHKNTPEENKFRWYMPYYLDIDFFGIHGIPVFEGWKKEPYSHLGKPASHGCIRLSDRTEFVNGREVCPAEFVFNWTKVGTYVIIINSIDNLNTYPKITNGSRVLDKISYLKPEI